MLVESCAANTSGLRLSCHLIPATHPIPSAGDDDHGHERGIQTWRAAMTGKLEQDEQRPERPHRDLRQPRMRILHRLLRSVPFTQRAHRVGREKSVTLPLRELFEKPAVVGIHRREMRASSMRGIERLSELINSMTRLKEAIAPDPISEDKKKGGGGASAFRGNGTRRSTSPSIMPAYFASGLILPLSSSVCLNFSAFGVTTART